MRPFYRIAMFIVVLLLAYISSPAQNKPTKKPPQKKPRQVWIRLKSGPIVTGNLVQMDPDSVDFKVKGILQSVPCDDVIGVMFTPPTPRPTPTPAPSPRPTPTPAPTPKLDPILTNDEIVEPMAAALRPTILYREKAKYTKEATSNGVEGTVVLEVVFRARGSITDIRVIRGLPDGLTENAIEAAKKIQFQPAMKDGQPISVRGNLEFPFSLYDPTTLTLLSPDSDAVFSHYPRKLTLKWKPYTKASFYRVRIQQGYPDSSEWSEVQELEIADTEFVFYFLGAQPGRWKIEALQSGGKVLAVSDWRNFRFTK